MKGKLDEAQTYASQLAKVEVKLLSRPLRAGSPRGYTGEESGGHLQARQEDSGRGPKPQRCPVNSRVGIQSFKCHRS
jgi:hypothetical protein